VFAYAILWIGPAVERFRVVNPTQVQALLVLPEKRTTLRNEGSALIVRVRGVDRYVLQYVPSPLALPANNVLMDCLKRTPMNDTAIS